MKLEILDTKIKLFLEINRDKLKSKEEKEIIPCLRECVRHLIVYVEQGEEKW